MHALRWPFLLLDALGLVVFTIAGCDVAIAMGQSPIIVIVAGMITGIAGGIIRDVLCNDVPLVFSSELYATVSIVTGVVYYLGITAGLHADLVLLVALGVGLPLRVISILLKWEMPKFVFDREMRK